MHNILESINLKAGSLTRILPGGIGKFPGPLSEIIVRVPPKKNKRGAL